MNLSLIDKLLAQHPTVADLLDWPFDFKPCEPYVLSHEWPVVVSEALMVFAEDGSGGAYTLLEKLKPEASPVIYLNSEGQVGTIATRLTELLPMIVALPYWRDLLKFSAGGELAEMRKAVPFLEQEIHTDEPDIDNKRQIVAEALNLSVPVDPVRELFDSVTSGMAIAVNAADGMAYDGLFNTFHMADNPAWRCDITP